MHTIYLTIIHYILLLPYSYPSIQMRNDLKLPNHVSTPSLPPGRVLIISNQDAHNIHIHSEYDMIIPPLSTIILLYDGERWVDIQALKVASTVRHSTLLTCVFTYMYTMYFCVHYIYVFNV